MCVDLEEKLVLGRQTLGNGKSNILGRKAKWSKRQAGEWVWLWRKQDVMLEQEGRSSLLWFLELNSVDDLKEAERQEWMQPGASTKKVFKLSLWWRSLGWGAGWGDAE